MPDLYLVVDLIVVFALIGLGLTVLLQNSRTELNRIFAFFVLSVGIWIIANYISNDTYNSPHTAVMANYFVFCFSYAAAYFLLRFSISLAGDKKAARVLKKLSIPLLLVAVSTFSPLVVTGAKIQGSVYALQFGMLAPLYFITLALVVIAVLYILGINIHRSKGIQKARLKLLFISACIALPLLMLMEAVLPSLTGWFGLTNVGITPMLIIVFGLYYGVVKHRLFDLRLLIIRSLAYVTTLGVISLFYGVTSYYFTTLVDTGHNRLLNGLLNIGLIVIAITAYSPLKGLFNKFTNKLFFRDSYDTQVFLDEFNKTLVATYELDQLLKESAKIIEENIKPVHCLFAINATENTKSRVLGYGNRGTTAKEDGVAIKDAVSQAKQKLIVTDELEDKQGALQKLLRSKDIVLVARLAASSSSAKPDVGYLMLGPKKSGNLYSSQDLKVIEIVANELVIAVQNALRFEEIENFNITLQGKVDEATRKLRRANERLRTLDETKDDFISMASHQLRTPLTSVKGYISMVLEGDAGKISATQKKLLTQSFFSSQRMVYLIADLLNVSRLKTGKFVIDAAPVNLAGIVEQELEQLKETADVHTLKLTYQKPKHFPELMLDETKTRQVIMNFVDNAIYYTPSGGHINVRLVDNPTSVELRVEDNGIGVPKSEQPHLFTKFYRAGNARKARPDGTGLGLFMAKKVIVAQGGSIIIESHENKGSTFGFVLSKSKLAVPDADKTARSK